VGFPAQMHDSAVQPGELGFRRPVAIRAGDTSGDPTSVITESMEYPLDVAQAVTRATWRSGSSFWSAEETRA